LVNNPTAVYEICFNCFVAAFFPAGFSAESSAGSCPAIAGKDNVARHHERG
jgi:hypothetical protein